MYAFMCVLMYVLVCIHARFSMHMYVVVCIFLVCVCMYTRVHVYIRAFMCVFMYVIKGDVYMSVHMHRIRTGVFKILRVISSMHFNGFPVINSYEKALKDVSRPSIILKTPVHMCERMFSIHE